MNKIKFYQHIKAGGWHNLIAQFLNPEIHSKIKQMAWFRRKQRTISVQIEFI